MRNQIFHSPGNEEAELAKFLGDGDPPPPHWDLYSNGKEDLILNVRGTLVIEVVLSTQFLNINFRSFTKS